MLSVVDHRSASFRVETPEMTPTLTLVVPMYQEAERVGAFIGDLSRWDPPFEGTEVIFVDDGSTDGTAQVVKQAMVDVDLDYRIVRLRENLGKGAAVKAGAFEARGQVIVSVDADGAVSTSGINSAVSTLIETEARLVIGNRRHVESTIPRRQPLLRRVAGRIFNYWVRALGLTRTQDTQCGLKAWYRRDTRRLLHALPNGYAWDLAVLHSAKKHAFDIAEVPVEWSHVDGSSVVPIRHGISMAAEAVRVRFRPTIPRASTAGLLLAVLLFAGFGLRLGMASITDNADARTLAWGSAFVAQGSLDPYKEIIDNSLGDPIPLGGIRSLSLAQGPIGVIVGAVPMFIGESLGLLDLGDVPNGRTLGTGELFAYKLSYLVPELLVLVAIGRLVTVRRHRLIAYAIWAFTPLAVFAWGQGLPEVWTIAVVLWTMVWLSRALESPDRRARTWAYIWALSIALIGAMGTKLLPIVLLVPIVALVARDRDLNREAKLKVAAGSAVAVLVAVLPYTLSPYLRTNMFTRFEFGMLFDTGGIAVGSALYPAQLPLVLLIAITLWMFVSPARRYEAWTVAALLVIATMSGVITHLMIWALAAVFLVARRYPTAALGIGVATGLATAWHLLTYDWLSGLVMYTWDRSFPAAKVWPWIASHIPGASLIGSVVSSAVLLASLFAIAAYAARKEGRHLAAPMLARREQSRNRNGLRAPIAAMVGVGVIGISALLAVPIIAGSTGTEVWSFAYAGYPTDALISIPRGGAWIGGTMAGEAEVDHLTFVIDRSSQPSLDELVFTIRDEDGGIVASASAPVWKAEPLSDRGPVKVTFDQSFVLEGRHLVIERRPGPNETWDLPIRPDGSLMPINEPITNLAAVSTAEGLLRPTVVLYDNYVDEASAGLLRTLTNAGRITGVAGLSLLVAVAMWLVLTRSTESLVPIARSRRHQIAVGES